MQWLDGELVMIEETAGVLEGSLEDPTIRGFEGHVVDDAFCLVKQAGQRREWIGEALQRLMATPQTFTSLRCGRRRSLLRSSPRSRSHQEATARFSADTAGTAETALDVRSCGATATRFSRHGLGRRHLEPAGSWLLRRVRCGP